MSCTQVGIDSALHPSACESNTTTFEYLSGSYTPDTPHSHDFEPCLGGRQAHGQGGPVDSCRCYRCTNLKVDPVALAEALADVSEQDQGLERVQWPPQYPLHFILIVIFSGY
jgi:hypothetical protein